MRFIQLRTGLNEEWNSIEFGITPFWLHNHGAGKWHFHILINFAFWYVELQIGDDYPDEKIK